MSLPSPFRYFPIEKGVYEVAPGLRSVEGPIFQFDSEFPKYRENKLACRNERLSKYYATAEYSPEVSSAVNRFLVQRLVQEHPAHFQWDGRELVCHLTRETLRLNDRYELDSTNSYASAFDALCSQVQEDVAVMSRTTERDWLSSIHLCSPSHWSAEEKIGKTFFDIHVPVPGIEKINRAASSFVDAMIHKGPYMRFVWGFGSDRRLNHHPVAPEGWTPDQWKGRSFQPDNPEGSPFFLRMERQVTFGLPEVSAAVFTIRVYFIDGEEIRRNVRERALLRSGLLSMNPESLAYKGLTDSVDKIVAWLDEAS